MKERPARLPQPSLEQIVESQPEDRSSIQALIAATNPDLLTHAVEQQLTHFGMDSIGLVTARTAANEYRDSAATVVEAEHAEGIRRGQLQQQMGRDLLVSDVVPEAETLNRVFGFDEATAERGAELESALNNAGLKIGQAQIHRQNLMASHELNVLAREISTQQDTLSRPARIGRKVLAGLSGATVAGMPAHLLMQSAIENGDTLAGDRPAIAAASVGFFAAWSLTSALVEKSGFKGRAAHRRAKQLENKR